MSDSDAAPAIRRTWPPHIVEQAYQVWSSSARRNTNEAQRQLAAILPDVPHANTIREWKRLHRWHDRAMVESADESMIGSVQYIRSLWVAAPYSIDFLSSVANGTITTTDTMSYHDISNRIRAAVHISDQAAKLLLQQSKADGRTKRKPADSDPMARDISQLDSAELEQYEQELRDKRTPG